MNNNFDFDFWKREFKKRFELNEITGQMLDSFIYYNPEMAKRYIIEYINKKYINVIFWTNTVIDMIRKK